MEVLLALILIGIAISLYMVGFATIMCVLLAPFVILSKWAENAGKEKERSNEDQDQK